MVPKGSNTLHLRQHFIPYNNYEKLILWREKCDCCEESVWMGLTPGNPSVPISKVDIKHFENKIKMIKCRFYDQTLSISVYKVPFCITSKYQLCISGSLHLWYKTTHQIAICCGSGYPGLKKKKKVEAVQTPARKASQMVWMRTVITYLVVGQSEREWREKGKSDKQVKKEKQRQSKRQKKGRNKTDTKGENTMKEIKTDRKRYMAQLDTLSCVPAAFQFPFKLLYFFFHSTAWSLCLSPFLTDFVSL